MTDDSATPSFNVHTVTHDPMPQFGGSQAVLYRSPDGRRMAGSFKESGSHTLTMGYDEFLYVIAGHASITVHGEERKELGPGDACYLREGSVVDFTMSPDFHDVTVLISETAIEY